MSQQTQFLAPQGSVNYAVPVTIANGQTTSAAINLNGTRPVAIYTPSALTGTTFTFTASNDGTTFLPVKNASGAVSYTVSASEYLAVNPSDFDGALIIKIVSGSSEAAARSFTIALKG